VLGAQQRVRDVAKLELLHQVIRDLESLLRVHHQVGQEVRLLNEADGGGPEVRSALLAPALWIHWLSAQDDGSGLENFANDDVRGKTMLPYTV